MVQNCPHAICYHHHNDHHRPHAKAVSGSGGRSELVPPINLWRLHSAVRALFSIRLDPGELVLLCIRIAFSGDKFVHLNLNSLGISFTYPPLAPLLLCIWVAFSRN